MELELNRVQLHVLNELPKHHRIVVYVEDPKLSVKEALELFDRQNEGLQVVDWVSPETA